MSYKEEHKHEHYQTEEFGSSNEQELCPDCHGSGSLADNTCGSCNGKGII